MNFLIVDKTANHESIFVDAEGETNMLEENAMVFPSENEAQQKINEKGWNWAATKETDFPVNM